MMSPIQVWVSSTEPRFKASYFSGQDKVTLDGYYDLVNRGYDLSAQITSYECDADIDVEISDADIVAVEKSIERHSNFGGGL